MDYKNIIQNSKTGAALTLGFKTEDGASNQFDIDLVFASEDEIHELISPIDPKQKIKCVSMDNIIADKLSACHQFGSGNTRMKDFDDLWRLSRSDVEISRRRLAAILKKRSVTGILSSEWITVEMGQTWNVHRKRYKDLPDNLKLLFDEVNRWLEAIRRRKE